MRKWIGLSILVLLGLGLTLGLNLSYKNKNKSTTQPTGKVKGKATKKILVSPTTISTPTITPVVLKKQSYTIAVFGDSFVDTMGEGMDYLQAALHKKYPTTHFDLYNYGIGSQNIETGAARFNSEFHYQTRNYPPISQINADVIVLGSFAYNPFSPHDRNKHYLLLQQLIQQAKSTGADVYQLVEQAPLRENFGKGPGGVNWDTTTVYEHSAHILEQLDDAINAAHATGTPIINVFYPSIVGSDRGGNPAYVDGSDGIHPSVSGHAFMANLIAETVHLR